MIYSRLVFICTVVVLFDGCRGPDPRRLSWSDLGISEVRVPTTVYETEHILSNLSSDNRNMFAAVNLTRNRIDLLQRNSRNSELDFAGFVVLPLALTENVVRCDINADKLTVISSRNIWLYDVKERVVKERVRTFVPLADICFLKTGEIVLTEYPVLNGESLVWLGPDLSFKHRFAVIKYNGRVVELPQRYEFLVTTISHEQGKEIGFLIDSLHGEIAIYGREGITRGWESVRQLLRDSGDKTSLEVADDKPRIAVRDVCQWEEGVALLLKSDLIEEPAVIELDRNGDFVGGVWPKLPEKALALSIASSSSGGELFILVRGVQSKTSRVLRISGSQYPQNSGSGFNR